MNRCELIGGMVIAAVLSQAAFGADVAYAQPRVVRVCTFAPDVVAVTVEAGKVVLGRQEPYRRRAGDTVKEQDHHRWLVRDGKTVAALVGADRDIAYPFDRVIGRPLDTKWADRAGSYRITSSDDPTYRRGAVPAAVHRKSKPFDLARTGPWHFDMPVRHVLFLRLARPLTPGRRYTVTFLGAKLPAAAFTYDPAVLRSGAVHVSHIGFRPDDPAKVAFLSAWLGSGGAMTYAAGLTFRVLDVRTGKAVFAGKTRLSKSRTARDEDAYKNNHNGADVWEMDFSPVTRPGTYRVSVAGAGCSYPFRIADDVWRGAFTISARGFYHQRSGIALGPPYTTFRRPQCFHPVDGVKVYASTAALMDTGGGLNRKDSNFGELVRGKTDTIVPNAWGGYMDAGDWDRRIQHLESTRLLLELAELFPDYFANLWLNIPESCTPLPDIVDEALFNLDFYRRLQTPEGGIRGGIESAEHPRMGEASWQESLTVMAYAPGIWSSHIYAGVAARAAGVVAGRDPKLAAAYRKSAVAAMTWAEAELKKASDRKLPSEINDERNLAAAELFRLTGVKEYHDLFVKTTAITSRDAELFKWKHHDQPHAAWVYLRTNRPGTDAALRANCRRALLRRADNRVAHCAKTGYRWTKYAWRPTSTGALTAPDAVSLVRAHVLTGEVKYLRAAVLACQTGLGANPLDLCYTTGVGHAWPKRPLHLDSRITNQPAPPGLTVFGPLDTGRASQQWAEKSVSRYCHPKRSAWPIIEAYWDIFWYPMMCEYTIQQPMARNAYTWGYLAARKPLARGVNKP